jgi:hypothetical protein
VTFDVIIPICDIDIEGSVDAAAWTITVPENVEQEANPFWLIVTPAGADIIIDGSAMDHVTWGTADIGAMLKVPIAEN